MFLPMGQDNFGYDLAAVEAAKKKHEAIETDTAAYEERVRALEDLAQELEKENYHDQKRITARKDNILRLWNYLQELLRARRQRLEMTLALQKLFQDMLHSIDWMDEIKVGLRVVNSPHPQCPPRASVPAQLDYASLDASQPVSSLSHNGETEAARCLAASVYHLLSLLCSRQVTSCISMIKKSWVHSTDANLQDLERQTLIGSPETQALGNHDLTLVRIQTSQHRGNQEV